ncbi:MAG: SCO family protein [Thiolinea sp.]
MKKYALFFTLLILLGFALVLVQLLMSRSSEQLQLTPVSGQAFGGDFTLQAGDQPVSLSDYAGKVVLIYFGYTSCPDVCPTSLGLLGAALKSMTPQEQSQVQGIFISVDPERDQGSKALDYARHFHPNFIGVTGTLDEVRQVARQYGSFFEKSDSDSALGYLVDHTSKTYVIGKDGKLAQLLPHDMTQTQIVEAVRAAL